MNTPSDKSNTTLHTVIIQTSHMEKLAAFYGGGLELGEPAPAGGDHLGFQMPNAYLGFDNVEESPEQSGVISLWFEVDDLEETYHRFIKMGAVIKYPPTAKPWGAILAAFYDPDGNLFGLTQRNEPVNP